MLSSPSSCMAIFLLACLSSHSFNRISLSFSATRRFSSFLFSFASSSSRGSPSSNSVCFFPTTFASPTVNRFPEQCSTTSFSILGTYFPVTRQKNFSGRCFDWTSAGAYSSVSFASSSFFSRKRFRFFPFKKLSRTFITEATLSSSFSSFSDGSVNACPVIEHFKTRLAFVFVFSSSRTMRSK